MKVKEKEEVLESPKGLGEGKVVNEQREVMRFEVGLEAMLKLMEWEYYRNNCQEANFNNAGLLLNVKPICMTAVQFADTLMGELDKSAERENEAVS